MERQQREPVAVVVQLILEVQHLLHRARAVLAEAEMLLQVMELQVQ
jgi:hypothetical protein